jgi:hypothetical protein
MLDRLERGTRLNPRCRPTSGCGVMLVDCGASFARTQRRSGLGSGKQAPGAARYDSKALGS